MQTEEILKQLLFELLKDKEVRGELRSIMREDGPEPDRPDTPEQPVETYSKQLEELRRSNQNLRDSLEKLRTEKEKAVTERNGLSVQMEQAEKAYQQELSRRQHVYEEEIRAQKNTTVQLNTRLEEAERRAREEHEKAGRAEQKVKDMETRYRPFQELLSCYEKYRDLNAPGIKHLLPDTDPVRFLSAGCQRETVTRLWDALRDLCEGDRSRDWETLLRTLRFLIDRYNSTMSAPVWSLMDAEQGKPFQETRHARSSRCSRYQGTVEQVLLPGIWNNNRNQAERKTVVYFG